MHFRSKSKESKAEAELSQNYLQPRPGPEDDGWDVESDNPPPYDDDVPSYESTIGSSSQGNAFSPSTQYQIQAVGYDYNSALCGMNFEQITVYNAQSNDLEYTSLRLKQKSNSCALIRGSDASSVPVIATVYRWGPGRCPRIKVLPKDSSATVEDAINSDETPCELVEVRSRNMFSRTQILETSFGTFEWRYGSRHERKAEYGSNSLLIMDKIDNVPSAGGLKTTKKSTRIAQLVRNDEFRTPGTSKHMGGNGGRLMIDAVSCADGKSTTLRDMEEFIIASCICMLKREADRFQNNAVATVT